jgi:fluoride exporter
MKWIWVIAGGGIGSAARFALSGMCKQWTTSLPWATLWANVMASLFIGVLFAWSQRSPQPWWWALLATGFCGGLSTFSTFSLEMVQLITGGQWLWAAVNALLNVALCLISTYLAWRCATA